VILVIYTGLLGQYVDEINISNVWRKGKESIEPLILTL
jgi:hypothetical protein